MTTPTATAAPTRCRQIWKFTSRVRIGRAPTFGESYRRAEILPLPAAAPRTYEIIDEAELAKRLGLKRSWVTRHSQSSCKDKIPCLQFGRWRRFQWESPELLAWLARQKG